MEAKKKKTKTCLSPNEVADLLMVSPITVRQWAQKGWIKAELTAGGHRRFMQHEVERFARERGLSLQIPEDDTLRILIIDDNLELTDYLLALFNTLAEPIVVERAHDGFEGGQKVEVFKPNIILLDLMMPGMDGFEVCARLKQNPTSSAIRIIAMTGYASTVNIQKILQAGAETCLAKPFKPEELFAAIGLVSVAEKLSVNS